ncbi:hypothetical protein H0H81_008711, partial [Sphagnurus paluster]
ATPKHKQLNLGPELRPKAVTGGAERKLRGACWNCGEKGHMRNKCPKPKVEKEKGKKGKAVAAAVESDSEEDGVFAAKDVEDCKSNVGSMPELQLVSDSEAKDCNDYQRSEAKSDFFDEVPEIPDYPLEQFYIYNSDEEVIDEPMEDPILQSLAASEHKPEVAAAAIC